ncbi:hypothetical protein NDU88_006888 [Pleurodeles waltl]|uniref:Uncharacterized protein n=1 Tax=Pleurodeles waltl TaxID=8319 RepID=A0AAV7VSP0_PLEWA|nr:hypothetical protein NDU88_006888 [Pleurodeles waltl]
MVRRARALSRWAVPSGGGLGQCLADGRGTPSVSGAGPVRAAARRPRVAGAGIRAGPPSPKTARGGRLGQGPSEAAAIYTSGGGEEERPGSFSLSRNTSHTGLGPPSPLTKKKKDMMEILDEEAYELLSYFNHRNLDALLRVTRNTLETIRKRIHASSMINFLGKLLLKASDKGAFAFE